MFPILIDSKKVGHSHPRQAQKQLVLIIDDRWTNSTLKTTKIILSKQYSIEHTYCPYNDLRMKKKIKNLLNGGVSKKLGFYKKC